MDNHEVLTPKRLKKMRHPTLVAKSQVVFIFWTFFSALATITLALVTFLGSARKEGINPVLLYIFIAAAILMGIGIVGLGLPKAYNKSWVDALNKKMYKETFGVSPLPKRPDIKKDILLKEKIERQTVEVVALRMAFSYPDGNRILLSNIDKTSEVGWSKSEDVIGSSMNLQNSYSNDLGKTELRRSLPVLFQGTYLRMESSSFSFSHRIEIRERRDSISPSSFYTEEAIIESLAFGDFDVYCDDLEFAKSFLTEERKKVLMEFASEVSRGLVLTVLPNALVFEVYGVECNAGPVPLNEECPTLCYEEKKKNISPFIPLISTFLRNSSNEKL